MQRASHEGQGRHEIAAKEHQLTKYRQEHREKDGSERVEAKGRFCHPSEPQDS